jgi:sulfur carrier protein
MQIYINGEERAVTDDATMSALIAQMELGDVRIAVEINEELVPRSTFDDHRLQPGDRIEIVGAIGGG